MDKVILSIVIIIIGLIATKYVFTPLVFYMMEPCVYTLSRMLSKLFPSDVKMFRSPQNGTIQGIYRVYSPNPINYILNRIPITPKETAAYFNESSNSPYLHYTLNVSLYPIIKNVYDSLLGLTHIKSILKRLPTKCK